MRMRKRLLSTEWPVIHGRVFLVTFKKSLFQCSRVQFRTVNFYKVRPCLSGHLVPVIYQTFYIIYDKYLNFEGN